MSDDLETVMRAALRDRAGEITLETLRHPSVPAPRGASRVRIVLTASVAAVAMVSAVAVTSNSIGVRSYRLPAGASGMPSNGVANVPARRGPGVVWATDAPALSGAGAVASDIPAVDPLEGTRWKLSTVGHDGQVSPVPAKLETNLEFSNGRVGVNDTVNWTSGQYVRTESGFTMLDGATTAEGYIGSDPDVLRVRQAVSAMTHGTTTPVGVNARQQGSALVVTAEGFVLTYVRDGDARVYSPPSPTLASESASTAPAACLPQDLKAAVADMSSGMSHAQIVVSLTNKGHSDCSLGGIPSLAVVDANGAALKEEYTTEPNATSAPGVGLTVASGSNAYFLMAWWDATEVRGDTCTISEGGFVRITLPEQTETIKLPLPLCPGGRLEVSALSLSAR